MIYEEKIAYKALEYFENGTSVLDALDEATRDVELGLWEDEDEDIEL